MSPTPLSKLAALALVLGLAVGGLNLIKPPHVDDPAYVTFAEQAGRSPLDPFGFEFQCGEEPREAFDTLVPPLVPYLLALPVRLAPDRPWVWKLAIAPFALLFAGAFAALCARWAPGREPAILILAVLSPVALPSLNLMLDVPSLALSLAAVAAMLWSLDRRSLAVALAAGVLAGLSAQSKYNGLLTLPALAVLGVVRGQARAGALAALSGGAVFALWEAFLFARYGRSHFLHHLGGVRPGFVALLPALFGELGGVVPVLVPVALSARGVSGRRVALAAAGVLAMIALLAVGRVTVPTGGLLKRPLLVAPLISGLVGALWLALTSRTAGELAKGDSPEGRFLAAWFAIELAGYFVTSPFHAARRVYRLAAVGLCVLAARSGSAPAGAGTRALGRLAVAGAALGLLHFLVDFHEANAAPRAIAEVEARTGGRRWFVGQWGFFFHARKRGWSAAVRGRARLEAGDWLVLHHGRAKAEPPPPDAIGELLRVEVSDPLPWSTFPGTYGAIIPLNARHGPRLTAIAYRLTRAYTLPPLDARADRTSQPGPSLP